MKSDFPTGFSFVESVEKKGSGGWAVGARKRIAPTTATGDEECYSVRHCLPYYCSSLSFFRLTNLRRSVKIWILA